MCDSPSLNISGDINDEWHLTQTIPSLALRKAHSCPLTSYRALDNTNKTQKALSWLAVVQRGVFS